MNRLIEQRRVEAMRGFSLMECVLALAVLAVVVPWVMLAMGQALGTGAELRLEEMATRVVPACLETWSRGDRQPVVYAIGLDGAVLGEVDAESSERGVKRWNEQRVMALCSVGHGAPVEQVGGVVMRKVHVRMSFPAAAASRHRRHYAFQTWRS